MSPSAFPSGPEILGGPAGPKEPWPPNNTAAAKRTNSNAAVITNPSGLARASSSHAGGGRGFVRGSRQEGSGSYRSTGLLPASLPPKPLRSSSSAAIAHQSSTNVALSIKNLLKLTRICILGECAGAKAPGIGRLFLSRLRAEDGIIARNAETQQA